MIQRSTITLRNAFALLRAPAKPGLAIVVASLAGALLCACWRSSPASAPASVAEQPPRAHTRSVPPPRPAQLVLEQFERFADDMCNCQDMQCAQRVADEMTHWSQDHASKGNDDMKMDADEQRRAAEIGERMGMCMQKVMVPPATGSATP